MDDIYVIDRFEGEIAVVEHGENMLDIPIKMLPKGAKSGDVLIKDGERYVIDTALTDKLKKEIEKLQDELFS